jgi:hypothetical protein
MGKMIKSIGWPLLAFVGLTFVLATEHMLRAATYQQYAWLANGFLHGHLDIPRADLVNGWISDMVIIGGKYYFPLGPLPAVLLMPLVAVYGRSPLVEPVFQTGVVMGIALSCYFTARRFLLSKHDATWLAFAFIFSSVAIGCTLVNTPWQIGNTLAALFFLLAAYAHIQKRSPAVIGALCGAALLTRYTAGLGIVFFIAAEFFEHRPRREQLARMFKMGAPYAGFLLLLLWYNHARFGNALDTGYSHHFLYPGEIKDSLARGVFRLQNVGRNFYFYFLKFPEWRGRPRVSEDGLSFFILSPIFLFACRCRRMKYFWPAVAVTVPSLAVYLAYFTTGFVQFGPRYLVELLPFWYLVLLEYFKKQGGLKKWQRWLIAASAAANIALFIAFIYS